jgi:hypothetical protein
VLPRLIVAAHAVLFVCWVLTAPTITVADLECEPQEVGELCLTPDNHTVLLAGRDVGGAWLRRLFLFVDFPAVIGIGAIEYGVGAPATPAEELARSWAYAAALLALGTLQWWVIGSMFGRTNLVARRRSSP